MFLDDTIAAIATPLGEGGLAVVRISGPAALAIADKSFLPVGKSSLKPSAAPTHTIQYGKIVRSQVDRPLTPALSSSGGEKVSERTGEGEVIDEVLVAVLRAPRTFTREDTVEITCHGGLLPAKLVLDTLLEHGARAAEPVKAVSQARRSARGGRYSP